MEKLNINISDREAIQRLGVDAVTLESIERALEERGSIEIPTEVLEIMADMRNPKSIYGAYDNKKYLYEYIGHRFSHNDVIGKMIKVYANDKGILFADIFHSIEDKKFTTYAKALNDRVKDDMDSLVDRVLIDTDINDRAIAKDFIVIHLFFNTYGGFVMEYMLKAMLLLSDNFNVLDKVKIRGTEIDADTLDKKYGVDLLIVPTMFDDDIHIPLQIKSETHNRVSRDALTKTFNAQSDYKRKHKGIVDKEAKGIIYYLHYDMFNLKIALINNIQFSRALPMSNELMGMCPNKATYNYVEVWDVEEILDKLSNQIYYDVIAEVDEEKYVAFNNPNLEESKRDIEYVRFYKDVNNNELF